MTKSYTLLLFAFLFIHQNSSAQNVEGCNGIRYYYDVFNDISKTIEQYGSNTLADGNPINLEMDVFQPEGDLVEKRPLIIWAHGGAFVAGERSDMDTLCYTFAKKGFVTATMSYRLYPLTLGIPDSLDMLDAAIRAVGDMKAVVRHFREDAATTNKYKIDPNHIYVGGVSAGAIMAVQVGYLDSSDSIPDYLTDILTLNGGLEGSTGTAENQSYSSEVQGVINLAGAIHKLDWIKDGDIPIMSYHGDQDDVVPYAHGFANVLGFDFMSVNGSGSIHNYIESFDIPNFLVTAVGATHQSAFESSYSVYLDNFITEGQLFLHELLCAAIAIDVDELLNEKTIEAFPIPSDDVITLKLPDFNGAYDLRVFDITGKEVFFRSQQYAKTLQLKKEHIGQGLFFVEIRTAQQTEMVKVIFK
ncbi:MAG: hypothetical protein ACI8YQ_000130 [Polaribacter sp.]|jgi:hypothetical protein